MTDTASPAPAPTDIVGCTVISKNYLSYARVLAESFRRLHPACPFYVLMCDRAEGLIDPSAEKDFTMIMVEDLEIPDFRRMAFKYNVIELDTAVKPFFFLHLMEKYGAKKLLYFDPDIVVFTPLHDLSRLLDAHDIVLTPHMTEPVEDGKLPSEQTIMLSGMYNLGFLAMRAAPGTEKLLRWWHDRLSRHCYIRQDQGLFVDQKWMDFAPSFCPNHRIFHDPGHNAAFWNLHERVIGRNPDGWTVNGRPLAFYHFSGYNPLKPDKVSKHQTRIFFADREPELRSLFDHYRGLQLRHGYGQTHVFPYAYDRFADGTRIGQTIRTVYGKHQDAFPEPFASGPGSFRAWLAEGRWKTDDGRTLNRLHEELYDLRADLRAHFPVSAKGGSAYADWLTHPAQSVLEIDEAFLPTGRKHVPEAAVRPPRYGRVRSLLRARHRNEPYQRFTRALKRVIGPRHFYRLKALLTDGGKPRAPVTKRPPLRRPGVNVSGYIRGELGLGEGVRGHLRALGTTDIPFVAHDIQLSSSRQGDRRFDHLITEEQPYEVNLIEVNLDLLPEFRERRGSGYFRGKYNIGAWMWELPDFPAAWADRFDLLDEVWAGSTFCRDTIAEASPVPVVHVPYVVEFETPAADRAAFGLPADRFVFLYMFDYFSVFERKNPVAAVEAFRRAFTAGEPVTLVIKSSNGGHRPEEAARLRAAAGGDPRIVFLDSYLTRAETHALTACCDAYVSPHRSEGFGLTVAEALYLAKPVIATDFSGTTDFLTADTGFPVSHSLVRITKDAGPYAAGNRWADPDIDHAAALMRQVYGDPTEASRRAARGARLVRERLSASAVGEKMRRRLSHIMHLNG